MNSLALALFRSAKADSLIERMGPIAAMWCIMDMLRQGSIDVWSDLGVTRQFTERPRGK